MSYLTKANNYDDIKKLYYKVDSKKEFEFMIYNNKTFSLSYQDYLICLEFLTKRAKGQKLKLETSSSLDIAFNKSSNLDQDQDQDQDQNNNYNNYRITIDGIDNINKYMKMLHDWKNHVIYKVLITKILDGATDLSIMEKVKDTKNVVDLDDYNMRARLSEENNVNKKILEKLKLLTHQDIANINFRFKERISVYILDEKNKLIKIDLTKTNTSKNINRIDNIAPNYELEIEYQSDSKPKNDDDLNLMIRESEILFKIIQQSNFIISKSTAQEVLNNYYKILSINPKDSKKTQKLEGRKPESLEIIHTTESLPNKYAVTDKADGERNFLIITNDRVYLINSNLYVRDTGIELNKSQSKYNGSLLDGENIFLPKENRHIMMIFDCLFNGSQDIRKNAVFMDRLKEADDIISNCFVLGKQKGYIFKNYNNKKSEFSLEDIVNFNSQEIIESMNNLNHDIKLEKKYILVRRKYFIGANGVKPWEIFKYSSLIWDKYTEDATIKCPYLLDGLIYHPLNQAYTVIDSENKFKEYKWKPDTKNSIDFYITFEKDPKTGKILNVYDNSNDDFIRNKPYRIINLFVGKTQNGVEEPFPFHEEEDGHQAYVFLHDGEVRDSEGKIISDKTVVEFYYNNNSSGEENNTKFRWMPIRTRYDKTEFVMKYKKGYGNYYSVADKVWRSIINPINMADMVDLAKGNNETKKEYLYDKKMSSLRAKIGKDIIVSLNKENAYYSVQKKMAESWRRFQNIIKSMIIFINYNREYQDNNRELTILDMACGPGGDIGKFYYCHPSQVVAVDVVPDNLLNPANGFISRYNHDKKHKADYPKYAIFLADARALFNYEDQNRALGGMSIDFKKTMEKHFSKIDSERTKFDRINCQFAIHYMFESQETLNNMKQNFNDYLKEGGFLVATTLDGEKIAELLGDNEKYSTYYTNEQGEKKLLWEIVRKYNVNKSKDSMYKAGNAIDFYGAWMFQEGQYVTEYLVDKRFIEEEFLRDCNLELVDTDTFGNLFENFREFFTKYAQYESVDERTKKSLNDVKRFYDEENTEINQGLILNNAMTRYYIFRKKENIKKGGGKSSKKLQTLDLADNKSYYIPKFDKQDNTLLRSIHEVLQTHKIIPKSEDYKKFYKSMGIKIPKNTLDMQTIEELGNKIVIEHELENGNKKNIINGISFYTLDLNLNLDSDTPSANKYNITKPTKKDSNANIVLLKEGSIYRPVYVITNEFDKKALFGNSDDFIGFVNSL